MLQTEEREANGFMSSIEMKRGRNTLSDFKEPFRGQLKRNVLIGMVKVLFFY